MRKYTLLLLLTTLLLTWPAFAAEPVRVGLYDNAPLSFLDDNDRPAGLTVDLLDEVAHAEGMQLEYIPCDWTNCLQMLEKGEIDLLGPIAFSQERATRYDFNQETILANWGHVYIPSGSGAATFTDLHNQRVAVLTDDIHTRAFEELMIGFDIPFEPVVVESYLEVFKALESGAADAGVVNRVFALQHEYDYRVQSSAMIFNPIEVRWAAIKGTQPDLLDKIDRNLANWKKDQGSVYYKTLDHWFGGAGQGWRTIPGWLKWLLVLVSGGMALIIVGNLMLRHQVRLRTSELQAEVAERHQVQLAQQEAERRYRDLFNGITDPVYVHPMLPDGFGPFIEVNDAACKFYGYTREQFKEMTVLYLHDPTNGSSREECYKRRQLLETEGHIEFEEIHINHSGRQLPVEVRARVSTINEQPVILSVVRDVTEQKMIEQERDLLTTRLLQSQKMEAIGRLAGGVAHDLNNLLSPVLGYAELLLTRNSADPTQEGAIRAIHQAALRAKEMVAQLLAFGRKQALTLKPVDINQLVIDFTPLLRQVIPTNIKLTTTLKSKLPLVKADAGQLEQVLLNLIVNARDAMPDGGEMTIGTNRIELPELADPVNKAELLPGGWYVVLMVTDTGFGITPDAQSHIFEPFFTTKEQGKGTGLGLSTAYGIMRQHHGSIRVQSTPGAGSTFSVFLPQPVGSEAEATKAAPAAPAIQRTAIPRGSETILLVEDDPQVKDMATAALGQMGYTVLQAASGESALVLLQEYTGPLHLMLTDVMMPEMDGQTLYHQVRASHPALKVLFMSGYTDDIIRQDEIGSEFHFIQKPFSLRTLASEIRRILENESG
jgi:two-component system cell cycle sensor histidine kinase/response regulator CckA